MNLVGALISYKLEFLSQCRKTKLLFKLFEHFVKLIVQWIIAESLRTVPRLPSPLLLINSQLVQVFFAQMRISKFFNHLISHDLIIAFFKHPSRARKKIVVHPPFHYWNADKCWMR